jgi:hypothetical protein
MGNAQKILERIRKEEIKPTPAWQVLFKRIFIWVGFAFAICFGAISFSVILYVVQQTDFDLLSHMYHSRLELILALMPYIWVVFLILFLLLSVLGMRNIPKGYKHSLQKIFGITTLLSIVFGTLICVAGGGQYIEQTFESKIGIYRGVEQRKIEMWSNPEEGRLSGEIISVAQNALTLRDYQEAEWTIEYPDAFIASRVQLVVGEKIKMIGEIKSGQVFLASEIKPWGTGQGGKGRGQRRRNNE